MAAKVTIEEIARQANTSPSTVSLVLRNMPGVGSETRQRVLAVARALGYRRRRPSTATSRSSTLNVGLILRFWQPEPSLNGAMPPIGPFYSWIVMGIEQEARAQGINLLFTTLPVDSDNHPLDLPTPFLDQPLDGILLVGSFRDETVAAVAGGQLRPVILVDAEVGPRLHDAIASDHESGAYAAVSHLIRAGHQKIALVGHRSSLSRNFQQRRDGYLRALNDHGISESFIEEGEISAEANMKAAKALLKRHPEITAVFGANDDCAIATMRAAHALRRHVPDDLSVIGFDDITHARETTPPLTTMAVDKVSMGRLAVHTLLYRLAWPDAAVVETILQPRLVERGSVAVRRP